MSDNRKDCIDKCHLLLKDVERLTSIRKKIQLGEPPVDAFITEASEKVKEAVKHLMIAEFWLKEEWNDWNISPGNRSKILK